MGDGRPPRSETERGVRPGPRRAAAASSAGEQWLALVVPADARTFHVESEKLAATLAEAGARIETDASSDVEIVSTARAVRGADVAIVEIGPEFGSAPKGLAGRVLHRVLRHVSTRVASARAERQLGKRGYEASTTVWDVAHDVFMPPLETTDGRRPAAEQLPQRALVVARRGPARPTILEQSIAEASEAAGLELAPSKGSVRPGFLLVADDTPGAMLFRYTAHGEVGGDTWHPSAEDARESCIYEYSDALGEWVDVPADVEDAHAYAIQYAADRLNSRGDW